LYFDELLIAIKNKDTSQNDRSKTSLELYVSEMLKPNSNLPEDSKVRLFVDGHQRLIWPLFNYALVFLALTMFLTTNNDSRKSNIKQLLYTFLPVMIVAYVHFTLQKAAYKEPLYIFICYLNIFVCIVFSIWKINKSNI
jgi:lipopolysaccharide export LptBFGC system permease protein LptF